jgi:flagellar biogenesis protein FliO
MWSQALPTFLLFVGAPLVIWWIRRSRPGMMSGLRVTSRTGLTRNGVVAVVETDGRRFLIGATDHGVTLLTELDREPENDTEVVVPMESFDLTDEQDAIVPFAPSLPGPGKSPIETLRAMTVRKPTRSSFPHARPHR